MARLISLVARDDGLKKWLHNQSPSVPVTKASLESSVYYRMNSTPLLPTDRAGGGVALVPPTPDYAQSQAQGQSLDDVSLQWIPKPHPDPAAAELVSSSLPMETSPRLGGEAAASAQQHDANARNMRGGGRVQAHTFANLQGDMRSVTTTHGLDTFAAGTGHPPAAKRPTNAGYMPHQQHAAVSEITSRVVEARGSSLRETPAGRPSAELSYSLLTGKNAASEFTMGSRSQHPARAQAGGTSAHVAARDVPLLDSGESARALSRDAPRPQREAASRHRVTVADILASVMPASKRTSTVDTSHRSVTEEVLPDADVAILSRLTAAAVRHTPVQTETLFVPVYRKGRFVLGELYGTLSLNAMALAMIADGHRIPVQTARRVVIDLNASGGFEFVEYEWFQGGYLVIAAHNIALNGRYKGHSTIFAPGDGQGDAKKPTKVIMRFNFEDARDCQRCSDRNFLCRCAFPQSTAGAPIGVPDSSSWSHWTSALEYIRTGSSLTHAKFTLATSRGDMRVLRSCRVLRQFNQRDVSSVRLSVLRQRYASVIAMRCSFPTLDVQLVESYVREQIMDAMESSAAIDNFETEMGNQPAPIIPDRTHSHRVQTARAQDQFEGALRTDRIDETESGAAGSRAAGKSGLPSGAMSSRGGAGKQYSCECGFVFTHRGHYNSHKRAVHMKLRPFKCSACDASFAKGSDLRRHASSVHGLSGEERLFSCSECSIDFRLASQLAMHFRVFHSAAKNTFRCTFADCEGIFTTKQGYKKHMLKQHGQVVD